MKKKKTERRGIRGTLVDGNQSQTQVASAGEWENAAFRGDRDGRLKVPREKRD